MCRRQPPISVVRALLNAKTDGNYIDINATTVDGLTALHFACYFGASSAVVDLLLGDVPKIMVHQLADEVSESSHSQNLQQHHPPKRKHQSMSRKKGRAACYMRNKPRHALDRRGRTALHCACAGFRTAHRPAIIHSLLRKDPFVASLADEKGRTPFSLMYDDYAEEIEEVIHPSVDVAHVRNMCLNEGGALFECFQILVLFLKADYLGYLEDDLDSALEISELEWNKNSIAVVGSVGAGAGDNVASMSGEDNKKLTDSPVSTACSGSITSGGEVDLTNPHFRLIHAASASLYTFPHGFFQLLLKVCGEGRVKEHDSDFHLPLHLAARALPPPSSISAIAVSPNRYSISTSFHGQSAIVYEEQLGLTLNYYPDTSTSQKNKQYATASFQPAESFSMHKTPIISHLLDIYPEAASIPDDHGKYPVLLAIESGKNYDYVIEPLLDAFPGLLGFGSRIAMHGPCDGMSDDAGARSMEDKCLQDPGDIHSFAGIEGIQASLMLGLTHPSMRVRNETASTVGLLMKRIAKSLKDPLDAFDLRGSGRVNPKQLRTDEFLRSIIRTSGRYGSVNARHGDSSDDDSKLSTNNEWAGVQATMLQALSAALSNLSPEMIQIPETPQLALDVATNMLKHEDITVRECAAWCIGAALQFLDEEFALGVVTRVVLPQRGPCRRLSMSSSLHSIGSTSVQSIQSLLTGGESNTLAAAEKNRVKTEKKIYSDNLKLVKLEDTTIRNGRALAAFRILTSSKGDYVALNEGILAEVTQLMQGLMLDDEAIVRESACLAMGAILGLCCDTPATLKEVRHTLLKCMRTTEEVCVQIAVARGLMVATRMKPHVFICKAATPILEGALMLAVSSVSPTKVQKIYHGFLWLALGIGDKESAHYGLSEYMSIADGENGKIMMSLVTKTLAKIESVRDILWSSTVYCEDEETKGAYV